MGNLFNEDFQDFIKALNHADVEYLLVGGYSVILHGYARTTGDLDLWINPTETNFKKLTQAFRIFGMPLFNLTIDKFLNTKDFDVFSYGRPPVSIELLTVVKGLEFDSAYKESTIFEQDSILVRTIQFYHLLEAKKASGRSRDLNDIEQLSKKKDS
jgi:hypothetical protein